MPPDENFNECYAKYKELIDKCIPKQVLERLLKGSKDEIVRGDAWEPPGIKGNDGKYYDESGKELPF